MSIVVYYYSTHDLLHTVVYKLLINSSSFSIITPLMMSTTDGNVLKPSAVGTRRDTGSISIGYSVMSHYSLCRCTIQDAETPAFISSTC